jgi:hypothetical protein
MCEANYNDTQEERKYSWRRLFMKKRNKYITLLGVLFFSAFTLSAEITFSGYAGAKMDFYSVDTEKFDPGLKIQSFFSGQFVFSQNIILNTEFSLATDDIIDNSIFKEAPASFKVDEISLVIRKQFSTATNYLSAFMGTYEPIGSDIFLRRQFGIQPIASKITESWLGLSGSIIYPMFGAGGADVIHFNSVPLATGIYAYVNHELEDSYVFNGDLRFAGNFRYFTFDLAAGIGRFRQLVHRRKHSLLENRREYSHWKRKNQLHLYSGRFFGNQI